MSPLHHSSFPSHRILNEEIDSTASNLADPMKPKSREHPRQWKGRLWSKEPYSVRAFFISILAISIIAAYTIVLRGDQRHVRQFRSLNGVMSMRRETATRVSSGELDVSTHLS